MRAQPLAAIEGVLGKPSAAWDGFLRPWAGLQIVVIAATDDASGTEEPTPVSRTVDLLRGLKPDGEVFVSVIGPGECSAAPATPAAAPRLLDLAAAFGDRGFYQPLCGGDFGAALLLVSARLAILRDPACFGPVRDADPGTPGVQAECAVTDTITAPDGATTTAVLPGCDRAPPPCWRLQPTDACPDRLALSVERPSAFCADSSSNISISCVGCIDANDPACAVPAP
jgi:hypothetical protein